MIRRLVRRTAPLAILAAVCMAPSIAAAQDVAIAPILPKAGVEQKVANNVTSLVSSELDFSSEFESASEIETKPKSLTLSCLNKAGCLKAIGRTADADFLVAGSIANAGEEYDLYLVLLDVNKGTYVRKVSRKVENSPSGLANAMGGVIRELTTGESPDAKEDASASVDDFDMFSDEDFDFGDDGGGGRLDTPGNSGASLDDFEEEPDDWELEEQRRRAEEEARRKEEEAARRRAEEEARRKEEEARRRAEEERRREEEARRREEEERRRAEEEAARRRAEEEAAAADELDDISFGSVDPDDIEVEIDDISFGDAASEIEVVDDDPYDDYEDIDLDALDDPDPRDSRSTSRDRSSDRDSSSRDRDTVSSLDGPGSEATIRGERGANDPRFGVVLRAGYSNFQVFDFVTYGAELSIPVGDVFFLDLGLAGYSTQRTVPPKLQEEEGREPVEWNTVAPFNFGVKYQPTNRPFRPYIGADVTVTPYTVSPSFRMAPGLRARGGFDYMVSDGFGLNLDLAAGFWYGSEFAVVQRDLEPLGGVPSVSLGTIILF